MIGLVVVLLAIGITLAQPSSTPTTQAISSVKTAQEAPTPSSHDRANIHKTEPVDGLGFSPGLQVEILRRELVRQYWVAEAARIESEKQEAEQARQRAAEQEEQQSYSSQSSGGAVSGDCAAMKPDGFPDSIIQRESGGDPNAYNPSGARGCAQILDSHFNDGGTCAGMDYQSCWQKMYDEQGLTPWACTPESGCG